MIEIHSLTKTFEKIKAVDEVSVTIKDNTVFGLIGTNGAGKSTVLRMISGVLKPDSGTVTVDNIPVYDNVEAKKKLFFIADEPYFFANVNAKAMERYYSESMRISTRQSSTNIWRALIWIRTGRLEPFPRE